MPHRLHGLCIADGPQHSEVHLPVVQHANAKSWTRRSSRLPEPGRGPSAAHPVIPCAAYVCQSGKQDSRRAHVGSHMTGVVRDHVGAEGADKVFNGRCTAVYDAAGCIDHSITAALSV